jgi:hypothetical protein
MAESSRRHRRCDTRLVGGRQEQSFDTCIRALAPVQPYPSMPKMVGIRIVVTSRREKIGWAQRGHNLGICAQSRTGAQI